ncbi:MAG: questin oxidase family protein [Candidatus Binataceae bacterium]
MNPDYSTLDAALEQLRPFGPESAQAGATHAPMVAETLCALGRADAVAKWLTGYQRRLDLRSGGKSAIDTDAWQKSLGRFGAYEGWVEFFDRELSANPWPVIRDWVPRLSRGVSAAAFHGLLRTAHVVRALSEHDTAPRRHELAEGLAYWSARYFPLPEAPPSPGTLTPSLAIASLPTLPASHQKMALESMISGLLLASQFQPFRDTINIVDLSGNPAEFLYDLTRTSAQCLIANRNGFAATVAFVHCVTGTSAVRLLIPYLGALETRDLLRYCWQVVAGLYVAFGPVSGDTNVSTKESFESMAERAIEVGVRTTDPHVIKFIEACERENRIDASPVYGTAANLAIDFLSGAPT